MVDLDNIRLEAGKNAIKRGMGPEEAQKEAEKAVNKARLNDAKSSDVQTSLQDDSSSRSVTPVRSKEIGATAGKLAISRGATPQEAAKAAEDAIQKAESERAPTEVKRLRGVVQGLQEDLKTANERLIKLKPRRGDLRPCLITSYRSSMWRV